jgi:hypothetical protein
MIEFVHETLFEKLTCTSPDHQMSVQKRDTGKHVEIIVMRDAHIQIVPSILT